MGVLEWTRLGSARVTIGAALVGLFTMGCGAYERESEYPEAYRVAPQPLSSEELAAQQRARAEAQAESRDVILGADDGDDAPDAYADTDPSALTEFKPALDGHGTWVDDGTYGTVWVPSNAEVGTDFEPYVSAGHWTYSDDADYVWVSDYSWGWAPFHYGRWVSLPGHGWSWIPGRRYSGAWVTWRTGGAGYGYVGWAPTPPSWYWYGGSSYGWNSGWYDPHAHYVYCPRERVYGGSSYVVRGPAAREHDGRTQDYIPASPTPGGRSIATPTVAGRAVASPSVNGGGRIVANPGVRGPRPEEMGLGREAIVAPPSGDQGLARARAVASPRVVATRPAAVGPSFNPRGPATSAFVPASPSVRPSSPVRGYTSPSYAPSMTSSPRSEPRVASPSVSPPRVTSSPSVSSPRAYEPRMAAPSVSPRFSEPRYAAPRVASPSIGSSPMRSPSVSSQPAFRPSSPSVRSGGSMPSMRSAPAPAMRSAPIRSAAPSVRKR